MGHLSEKCQFPTKLMLGEISYRNSYASHPCPYVCQIWDQRKKEVVAISIKCGMKKRLVAMDMPGWWGYGV